MSCVERRERESCVDDRERESCVESNLSTHDSLSRRSRHDTSLCARVSCLLLYLHTLLTVAQREENDSRLAMQRAVEEEEEARVAVKAAVGGNLYKYI